MTCVASPTSGCAAPRAVAVPARDHPAGSPDRNPIRYLNDGVSQTLFVGTDGHRPRLAFPTPSRRAVFHPRPHVDAAEHPDDDYPSVLNTGRLQHQWHTMTKTGRVAKLTKLNPKPFIEIHPDDAEVAQIANGSAVEVVSRRGRAVLPALVSIASDREHVGAVPLERRARSGSDRQRADQRRGRSRVTAAGVQNLCGAAGACVRAGYGRAREVLCQGFLAGIEQGRPGVPVLPADAPLSMQTRLFVEGMLAGRYSRAPETSGALVPDGPLVLWASQTGNAEEFAEQVSRRLGGSRLAAMDDVDVAELTDAGEVVIVTSTFGDGGPPDNGTAFWERLADEDAPALGGLRYSVLGLGDRSYGNFCGHAKSLDARLTALGATRVLDRADCEVHDQEPMTRWADAVVETLTGEAPTGVVAVADPVLFTRANPVDAPLCRNVALTPPDAAKEVRQFGFDTSGHDVSYAAGTRWACTCGTRRAPSRHGCGQRDLQVTRARWSTAPRCR